MRVHIPLEATIHNNTLRVVKASITDIPVEAFVLYAREDLDLGSGFGTAIKTRGGPAVRKELEGIGPVSVTKAVVTNAGDLEASYIVHAVGPKFQEEDAENKLKKTIMSALEKAGEKGVHTLAFPLMGAGFYGIPLTDSARITIHTIAEYLNRVSGMTVIVCANDSREYKPASYEIAGLN